MLARHPDVGRLTMLGRHGPDRVARHQRPDPVTPPSTAKSAVTVGGRGLAVLALQF